MSYYALMFHHFFDHNHPRGQGAISSSQFSALLDYYKDRLLSAEVWTELLQNKKLEDEQLCLTFDDGLLCQYDIALPEMEKRGLKGFWFPYTSALAGESDRLEIYRLFRTVCFADVNVFYKAFDVDWQNSPYKNKIYKRLDNFLPSTYLSQHSFYTEADRRFRFIRDQVLEPDEYYAVMDLMLDRYQFDKQDAGKRLWMTEAHLSDLHHKGHIIGLHSHTHPTNMISLPMERQKLEYNTNASWVKKITGSHPFCVSYPCGSYDEKTLEFMSEIGVSIGFRADMHLGFDLLTIPRLDHAIAMKNVVL